MLGSTQIKHVRTLTILNQLYAHEEVYSLLYSLLDTMQSWVALSLQSQITFECMTVQSWIMIGLVAAQNLPQD